MTYVPLGDRVTTYRQSVRVTDATWDLFGECCRRADLLSDRRETMDRVLSRACRLLLRQMEREAARKGVDLSRPVRSLESPGEDSGESGDGFRGPPRPPAY